MQRDIPTQLRNNTNRRVIEFLHGKSAHSDIASVLQAAVKPLGDVQLFCPDPQGYAYMAASSLGVIFGFAVGMHTVAFRLDARMKERALLTGAVPCAGCGEGWVEVVRHLPDSDWPAVDVAFWARKAYGHARELAATT